MPCQLVSYDIFDTLVTRRCFKPTDLFLFVPERASRNGLQSGLSGGEFEQLRIDAERNARNQMVGKEISLEEIYANFPPSISTRHLHSLRIAEEELEMDMASPVAENVKSLTSMQKMGVQTVCVSDMYLSVATVRGILDRCAIDVPELFVSSDIGATKRTGDLFDYVRKNYRHYTWRLHTGDHPLADIKMAQQSGIPADFYSKGRETGVEVEIYNALVDDRAVSSLVAGSLRSSRLARAVGENHPTFNETVAPLAATAGAGFVHWQCKSFQEDAVDRVFFLARDGYIPYRAYQRMGEIYPDLPPASYLRVSRASLRLASLSLENAAEESFLDSLLDLAPNNMNLRSWLDLTDEENSELEDIQKGSSRETSAKEVIKALLQAQPKTVKYTLALLRAVLARQTTNLLRYLASEGFFSVERVGIVDLGWNGSLQRDLDNFIQCHKSYHQTRKGPQLLGYYWGLRSRPPEIAQNMRAWLFDLESGRGSSVSFPLQVIELIFGDYQPTTLSYKDDGHKSISPVQSPSDEGCVEYQRLEDLEGLIVGILQGIAQFVNADQGRYPLSKQTSSIRQIVARFLHAPKPAEARNFEASELRSKSSDPEAMMLMPRISDLRAALIGLHLMKLPSPNYWTAGRLALIDKFPLRTLRAINFLKFICRTRR